VSAVAAIAPPLVELRDIHKSFDRNHVLRGVSLGLNKGTILAVMGGSGSGKTVLLRISAGLLRPDSGEVRLFGARTDRMREESMLPLRRRTGFVFQGAALFDSLSVFENVAYPLREHTRMSLGEITDRVHHFLSLVGLPDTDDLLPAELSGGMRKRVGIARALVVEPEVVFFDEPTAGLDPTNARLVAQLIAQLRTGVCDTAIVVTHDVEFAELVADQMAILLHGRFADMGTPAEIHRSADPDVRRFLTGELREI
jgi:phospholipid/cholesterol/gamma-HCH transport system ATP-binding protein